MVGIPNKKFSNFSRLGPWQSIRGHAVFWNCLCHREQPSGGGVCLVDGADGKELWGGGGWGVGFHQEQAKAGVGGLQAERPPGWGGLYTQIHRVAPGAKRKVHY